MTDKEILQHIDNGANFYVSLFGNAIHMETVEKEYYSYVKPITGEYGISFVYNIHIETLPLAQKELIISEIKSLNMPIWLNLLASDDDFFMFFGKEKIHGQTVFDENDEIYMALLPEEKRECLEENGEIIKIHSADEFAVWAQLTNNLIAGGSPDIHPVNHYNLCEKGIMHCYIMYHNNIPVSVAAIMNNNGVASLEFVATISDMRKHGFAKAICAKAVNDAFFNGASIITVRAINATAGKLYQSIGFKPYNFAI